MRSLILCVALALAFLAPGAAAQTQQSVLILHDSTDDGVGYVGNPMQFAFMLINDDGSTNVHRNGHVVVKQNDVVLYETLGYNTAHDYDALNPFLVTFPVAGTYTIEAEIPVAGATLKGSFKGTIERRDDLVPVTIQLEGNGAPAGTLSKFAYQIVDANGTLVEHSDAFFEVRRASDNFLLFRTKTHSHDGPQSAEFAFPAAGQYLVRVIGYQAYPTKSDAAFQPVAVTKQVTVAAGASSPPGAPVGLPVMEASAKPSGKAYRMYATYDPDPTVGMFGNMRLNTLVYDPETKAMVPHVDFTATLTDPNGAVLFRSDTLHEYDGHLEVVTQNGKTGTYRLLVEARQGDWKGTKTLAFDVAPPVAGGSDLTPDVPFGAGPFLVTATGLDALKAGTPQDLTFKATTAGGAPWQHSEIDLQVVPNEKFGVPLYLNKLHTHGDGLFKVSVNFPQPGDYFLILDAEPVHRDAATSFQFGKLGDPIIVPVKVAPGAEIPEIKLQGEKPLAGKPEALSPSAGLLLLVAAIAVALGFHGRRP